MNDSTAGGSAGDGQDNEEENPPVAGTSSEDGAKRKATNDEEKEDNRDCKTARTSSDMESVPVQPNQDEEEQREDMLEILRLELGQEPEEPEEAMILDGPASPNSSSSSSITSSSSSSSNGSVLPSVQRDCSKDAASVLELLHKPRPKHKWFITPEIVGRQFGFSSKTHGAKRFEERMHGSLHSVKRLELMYKLQSHTGCVNCVSFNPSGRLLASCSDDLQVCVWDWAAGKSLYKFTSGHRSNVFQCKFLPLDGHTHIATAARDGQVRLLELDSAGCQRNTRRVGHHTRPCHKLGLIPGSPHCFYSCAEDAIVFLVDIRRPKASKQLTVREEGKLIPLYSISTHPMDENEFMIGGRDRHLRIYDRRSRATPLRKLWPTHFSPHKRNTHAYVSAAVYNYNGTEVLASYNDDDIYLWDRTDSANTEYVHKYKGHRNNATLKGVNFFGPKSEFVVSGSDCGNIFFWDRETEAIVQWMAGDENGVVNCLEPHPSIPVLATSGLDDDVKIWVPSCEQDPTFQGLKRAVMSNHQSREDERMDIRQNGDIDGQMLWLLWRHLQRTAQDQPDVSNVIPPRSPTPPEDMEPEEDYVNYEHPDCSPS